MEKNGREKILNYNNDNLKSTSGITLIALIITIIVLLILAGVSLSGVFSDKGIFSRAESSSNKYNEAKAREVLETVLAGDGLYEKYNNPEYNQDDFLDALIKKEIEGSDVKGDVAIVGDYAFELDRSVPKIGRYLGDPNNLVFPNVEIISGPTLINNGREATFTAKASVTENTITKIELWLNGKRIDKYTKNYSEAEAKSEITEEFIVKKNGVYTIKAYADLMGSKTVDVIGIVPTISFSPNGSTEWRKEHTTQITVEETSETIIEMKYVWVKDDGVNEPEEDEFTENCPSNNIITGNNMTGTYYLWIMLKTSTGKMNICVSEAFNFDNEKPSITLTATPTSVTSFTLTATANDETSGIGNYEFYVNNKLVHNINTSEKTISYTVEGAKTGETVNCFVIAKDKAENEERASTEATTKLYKWEKCTIEQVWELKDELDGEPYSYKLAVGLSNDSYDVWGYKSYSFNSTTGNVSYNTEHGYFANYGPILYGANQDGYTIIVSSGSMYKSNGWLCKDTVCQKHIFKKELVGTKTGTVIETVESADENAYPKDGVLGDYWYKSKDNV